MDEILIEIEQLSHNFDIQKVILLTQKIHNEYSGNEQYILLHTLIFMCILEGKQIGIEVFSERIKKEITDTSEKMLIDSEFSRQKFVHIK